MIDIVIQTIVNAYESLVQPFGSPAALLTIAAGLVAVAAFELYVRKRRECLAGVR